MKIKNINNYKKNSPNNSKNIGIEGLRHQAEYLDFIIWIATPNSLRVPKTQQELAKKFGVGQDTLSEWKTRHDFWIKVKEKRKEWGRERTPDVILALYNRIIKTGGAQEVKLWLQYFEDWSEKIINITSPERPFANLSDEELTKIIAQEKKFLLKK